MLKKRCKTPLFKPECPQQAQALTKLIAHHIKQASRLLPASAIQVLLRARFIWLPFPLFRLISCFPCETRKGATK